jgi:hypothetical protein
MHGEVFPDDIWNIDEEAWLAGCITAALPATVIESSSPLSNEQLRSSGLANFK